MITRSVFDQFLLFQADVGQEEDFEEARQKAIKLGAKKVRRLVINCHVLIVYISFQATKTKISKNT